MLFWQGILSTGWGQDWTLWQLRYPNVLYTLATALLVGLLGWKISHKHALTGILVALVWLAFFSTYRFGRPYLTNAGEVFWLFMPFFLLLFGGRKSFDSRMAIPLMIAICIGIGLLYKSFALLLPVGVGLAFLQVNILATAFAIGCATFVMSTLGMMVGRFIGPLLGKRAEILGGIVLIAIGAQILYAHYMG